MKYRMWSLRCPKCGQSSEVVTNGKGEAVTECTHCGFSSIKRRQPTFNESLNPKLKHKQPVDEEKHKRWAALAGKLGL